MGQALPAQGYFIAMVRDKLLQLQGSKATAAQDALRGVLAFAVNVLKEDAWDALPLVPEQRFTYLRALPMLLLLLDSPKGCKTIEGTIILDPTHGIDAQGKRQGSLLTDKGVDAAAVGGLLKSNPVVPVFGDLTFQPRFVLGYLPSFQIWGEELQGWVGSKETQQASLRGMMLGQGLWQRIRNHHKDIGGKLAHLAARLRADPPLEGNSRLFIPSGMDVAVSGSGAGGASAGTATGVGSLSIRPGAEMDPDTPDKGVVSTVWDIVREALGALGGWCATVQQQHAAKFLLRSDEEPRSAGPGRFAYEANVRNNYSRNELSMLADVIAAVKSVAGQINAMAPSLAPVLRYEAHSQVQFFVHGLVTDQLTKAKRKRDTYMEGVLLDVRCIAAEWVSAFQLARGTTSMQERAYEEAAKHKKDVSTKGSVPAGVPPGRLVGPSPAQRVALHIALEMITDPSSKFSASGGMLTSKLIRPEKVTRMVGFQDWLAVCPHVMDCAQSAARMSDLSALWMREVHLSLDKQVQFPIDMSLPWMLTEHCLEVASPHSIAAVLPVLQVYNDAAAVALKGVKQRHLFAEIEAEMVLVFSQFVELAARGIYDDLKTAAAHARITGVAAAQWHEDLLRRNKAAPGGIMGGLFGAGGAAAGHGTSFAEGDAVADDEGGAGGVDAGHIGALPVWPRQSGMMQLLHCRRVSLLGRSGIDLGRHLAQSILQTLLRRDVERAVRQLESDFAEGIVDYMWVMDILEATHGAVCAVVPCAESWAHMRREAESLGTPGGGTDPMAGLSRPLLWAIQTLVDDVLPYYAWNSASSRFVRAQGYTDAGRDLARKHQKAASRRHTKQFGVFSSAVAELLAAATASRRGYFGTAHVDALVRCLSSRGLHILSSQMLNHATGTLLSQQLKLHFAAILEGLLPMTLPSYHVGAGTVMSVLTAKAKHVDEWVALRPRAFQCLREIGNALGLLHIMSDSLTRGDITVFLHTSPMAFPPSANGFTDGMPLHGVEGVKGGATGKVPPLQRMAAAAQMADAPAAHVLGSKAGAALPGLAGGAVSSAQATAAPLPLFEQAMMGFTEALYAPCEEVEVPQGASSAVQSAAGFTGSLAELFGSGTRSSAEDTLFTLGAGGMSDTWHRVWSAVLFLMVCSGNEEGLMPMERDYGQFGDGFLLAGACITHLLNQSRHWELCDLTSHVLRTAERDAAVLLIESAVSNASLARSSAFVPAAPMLPGDEGTRNALHNFNRIAPAIMGCVFRLNVMLTQRTPAPLSEYYTEDCPALAHVSLSRGAAAGIRFAPPAAPAAALSGGLLDASHAGTAAAAHVSAPPAAAPQAAPAGVESGTATPPAASTPPPVPARE